MARTRFQSSPSSAICDLSRPASLSRPESTSISPSDVSTTYATEGDNPPSMWIPGASVIACGSSRVALPAEAASPARPHVPDVSRQEDHGREEQ